MSKNKSTNKSVFREEIRDSFYLFNLFSRRVGLPGLNDSTLWSNILFAVSTLSLTLLLLGEFGFLILTFSSTSIDKFAAQLHITGYGLISIIKAQLLWKKRFLIRKLAEDLEELWSITDGDQEATNIKTASIKTLYYVQFCYAFGNVGAVWIFILTPLMMYIYERSLGQETDIGFVFSVLYPFDKYEPVYHEFVYVFEAIAAQSSVWFMMCADLLFTTMTSHLSMLLRQLQHKIQNVTVDSALSLVDTRAQINGYVKKHQTIIRYSNDLVVAFSAVNLINILLSSVNICCAGFTIVVMEPWLHVSNKSFLVAATAQMGILCWYADDVFRASVGVADSVYRSQWYNSDVPSRKSLLILMQRSQKPLYFTAMGFSDITMNTYTSILASAYSYFTLLYTIYRKS